MVFSLSIFFRTTLQSPLHLSSDCPSFTAMTLHNINLTLKNAISYILSSWFFRHLFYIHYIFTLDFNISPFRSEIITFHWWKPNYSLHKFTSCVFCDGCNSMHVIIEPLKQFSTNLVSSEIGELVSIYCLQYCFTHSRKTIWSVVLCTHILLKLCKTQFNEYCL